MIRIISWNAGSLWKNHGLILDLVEKERPDILCIQEVRKVFNKTDPVLEILKGYSCTLDPPTKKGHYGVVTYENCGGKTTPVELKDLPKEGRILKSVFKDFSLYNVYFPVGSNLDISGKLKFFNVFIERIRKEIENGEKIIICGDFNIVHTDLDLYNFQNGRSRVGYFRAETEVFDKILELGFTDVFRDQNPEERKYTHWINRENFDSENKGWRIDYFLVSNDLLSHVLNTGIYDFMSFRKDHAPIFLDLNL